MTSTTPTIPSLNPKLVERATASNRGDSPDDHNIWVRSPLVGNQLPKLERGFRETKEIMENMDLSNFYDSSKYEVDAVKPTLYVVNAKQPAEEVTFNMIDAKGNVLPVATYVRVDELPTEVLNMVRAFKDVKKKAEDAILDPIIRAAEEQEQAAQSTPPVTLSDRSPGYFTTEVHNEHIDIVRAPVKVEQVSVKHAYAVETANEGNPIIKNLDAPVTDLEELRVARVDAMKREIEIKIKTEWDDNEGAVFAKDVK